MNGKTKRTMLLLTLFVMVAANVHAADRWQYLGADGKTTYYFYNPKTYAMKKNIVSTWTKVEYNVDVTAMTQKKIAPDEYTGSKSVRAYEEFNCIDRKKRTKIGKIYEGSDFYDVNKTDWTEIQPGSIDEALLNALCREVGGKKQPRREPARD